MRLGATVRSGTLDQRVVIQTPTTAASTQSGAGAVTFSTLATVWASVRALSAEERLEAGAVSSLVTYEIEMRYRADVTPGMRVQWTPYSGTAKTFEVHGIRVGGRVMANLVLECGVRE
jgi:SPP1 family predicted phage head-tail adaptor